MALAGLLLGKGVLLVLFVIFDICIERGGGGGAWKISLGIFVWILLGSGSSVNRTAGVGCKSHTAGRLLELVG